MSYSKSAEWWSVFCFIKERALDKNVDEGTLLSEMKYDPTALLAICEHRYGIKISFGEKPITEITVGRLVRKIMSAQAETRAHGAA